MTKARSEQVSLADTPFYHCYSRCVRRAFLCGLDRETGADYSHRKAWIVARMRQLVSVFCLDICAYAVMDNHYHVVLRVDMELAEDLSVSEVLIRWSSLFSGSLLIQRYLSSERDAMSDGEIAEVHALAEELRERLVDISWFMRCLNEFIARMANKEDGCKGRFWEGRFKSQALLDDVAVLACMTYVDLNPVRAGLADSPEESAFTSIQERIHGYQTQQIGEIEEEAVQSVNNQSDTIILDSSRGSSSAELPVKPLLAFIGNERQDQPKGINFSLDDYLQLVDWTGRAIVDGKRGFIPDGLPPILTRLQVDPNQWVDTVKQFHKRYPRMAGSLERMQAVCEALGLRWLHGVSVSRVLYLPIKC